MGGGAGGYRAALTPIPGGVKDTALDTRLHVVTFPQHLLLEQNSHTSHYF